MNHKHFESSCTEINKTKPHNKPTLSKTKQVPVKQTSRNITRKQLLSAVNTFSHKYNALYRNLTFNVSKLGLRRFNTIDLINAHTRMNKDEL